MSVPMLTILLPDGSIEYRSRPETPAMGDEFRYLSQDYVVDTLGHDEAGRTVVTLWPAAQSSPFGTPPLSPTISLAPRRQLRGDVADAADHVLADD
jgi:hypothetical protein